MTALSPDAFHLEDDCWTTVLPVPAVERFRGAERFDVLDEPSSGTVHLRLHTDGGVLTEDDVRYAETVVASLPNELPVALATLAEEYELDRSTDSFGLDDEVDELMPPIDRPDELTRLLGIDHRAPDTGLWCFPRRTPACYGISFVCAWDVEHGVGVRMAAGETVSWGYSDVAWDCHSF